MEYQSISQGIFFRKRKRGGSSSMKSSDVSVARYFEGFSPPLETVEPRIKLYQYYLSQFQCCMQNLKLAWQRDLVTQVYKFVSESNPSALSGDRSGAVTPLAFIVSGMVGDENADLMEAVAVKIRDISPHVATISSEMNLNIKSAFQYLARQLMNEAMDKALDYSSAEDDMEDTESSAVKYAAKQLNYISGNYLKTWYAGKATNPLVIIFEEIDLFPAETVRSLITAFSCLKLPIIFVGCVTACCETIEAFVSSRCPTTFVYKTFTYASPELRMENILDQILKLDSPFQLSGEVLGYFANLFLQEEFSTRRLEQIYQLCLLEHYRLPESVFCGDNSYLNKHVLTLDVLTQDVIQATFANNLESFKGDLRMKIRGRGNGWKVDICSPKKTLRQTEVQLQDVQTNITNFCNRQLEWKTCLKFLFHLAKTLPGIPSDFQSLYRLYILAFSGALFQALPEDGSEQSPLDQLMSVIGLLARPKLESQLMKGLKTLELEVMALEDRNNEQTNIYYFANKIKDLLLKVTTLEQEGQLEIVQESVKPKKFKTRYEWQQNLKESAEKQCSKFSKQRESIVLELSKAIKQYLKPLVDHQYAKIFVFDDVEFLREMVSPSSHKRLHAAFVEPTKFLKTLSPHNYDLMSDVAIVYSLILEQQLKNINLNVIFDSFKFQAESNSDTSSSPKKRKAANPSKTDFLLYRFRQAIAELQHMGFIKQVKSKVRADEFARLHFGF